MSAEIHRLQSRAYQLEMFEAAMKGNVIVAMATGSGKTNVACLRVEAELQRTPAKRVWFTAPNTVLAEQQHFFLASQLPQYRTRTLLGSDNVDRWRMQDVWDDALAGVDVVICTPQVLLDALRNAFVRLDTISLLVIDEAHHCQAGSPSAKIMQEHYHPLRLQNPMAIPHILGLTASIRISTKTASIETLESNLNAICRTPTLTSEDYTSHVYVPQVLELTYTATLHPHSTLFQVLNDVVNTTKIDDDPYYNALREATDLFSVQKLRKIEEKQVTPSMKELRALRNNAQDLHQSLGPWASDDFIQSCIENWHQNVLENASFQESIVEQSMTFIDRRLTLVSNAVHFQTEFSASLVSAKALTLINLLANEYHEGIAVIIFVERRSAAFALCRLLSNVPELRKYRIFSFVGLATSRSGSVIEIADRKLQKKAFADFRNGSQDICIATSVAEEGVDIQAVNLVIRYDDPKQFVGYLQSRGRARRKKSKFVYFRDVFESNAKYKEWAVFEKQMEIEYKREKELLETARAADNLDPEDVEVYTVSSTEAKLLYGNSTQHLQHFCNVVAHGADPIYILNGTPGVAVTAKVVLPSNVPPPLQQASAKSIWFGEKAAKRDAAFQAYKALHLAGLVTDNLVPHQPRKLRKPQIKHETRLCEIPDEVKVWQHNTNADKRFYYKIEVHHGVERYAELIVVLPIQLKMLLSFQLSENIERTLNIVVTPLDEFKVGNLHKAKLFTRSLFRAVFDVGSALGSLDDTSRLPLLLLPGVHLSVGESDALEFDNIELPQFLKEHMLIWERQPLLFWKPRSRKPYIWHPGHVSEGFRHHDQEVRANKLKKVQLYTAMRNRCKTGDFIMSNNTLKVSECYARPAATIYGPSVILIPSILHMMAAGLRAQRAQETVLEKIRFWNAAYLVQALMSKSAAGFYNYERLEFLGDAYLKFRACLQMFANNPIATEGALDVSVSELTSNLRLEQSVRALGLEAYITTEVPTQKHWKLPLLADDSSENTTRKVTSKTLADVVESTLAAVYLDSVNSYDDNGEEQCTNALQLFLPEVHWIRPSHIANSVLSSIITDGSKERFVLEVKQMLGYEFRYSSLLREALTHSTKLPGQQSLDRLEFLGDAIIDWILKARLYERPELDADRMTLCRHATASHVLFAYSALGVQLSRAQNSIGMVGKHPTENTQQMSILYATDLVWFNDVQLRQPIHAARQELERLKPEIDACLNAGVFPWTQLRRINAPKICSDIVESLTAAVYVDSGGSLVECERVLDCFGILHLLDRLASNANFELRTPAARLREYCAQYNMTVDISPADDDEVNSLRWKVVIRGIKDNKTTEYVGRKANCKDEARSVAAEMALEAFMAENHFPSFPNQQLSLMKDATMTDADVGEDEYDDNNEDDIENARDP